MSSHFVFLSLLDDSKPSHAISFVEEAVILVA